MLKCSSERCVCAPHNLSAGTAISPMLSVSLRISTIWAPLPTMRTLVLLPGFMCDADLWTDMVPDLGKQRPSALWKRLCRRHAGRHGAARARGGAGAVRTGGFFDGWLRCPRSYLDGTEARPGGVAFVATSAREYTMEERERRQQGFLPGNRPKSNGNALGLHPDRDRDPVLLDRLRGMQRRLGPEVRKRQSALIRKDGYEDLRRITCPALVIACRQDRLRKLAETERMAKNLPQRPLRGDRGLRPHGPARKAARTGGTTRAAGSARQGSSVRLQRLARRSISTMAPRARPVTPMQVRAGRRSVGK